MFDFNSITLGEMAKVEELSGQSISEFQKEGKPQMKLTMAFAYILKKREDPKITFLQIENMKMSEVEKIFGIQNDEDDELKKEESSEPTS